MKAAAGKRRQFLMKQRHELHCQKIFAIFILTFIILFNYQYILEYIYMTNDPGRYDDYDNYSDYVDVYNKKTPIPIDIVYTYVNGKDSEWINAFHQAKNDLGVNFVQQTLETRYEGSEELRYSLRSVEQFILPWVKRIFIVVADEKGQIPKWLRAKHPKIQIVTHSQIFLNTKLTKNKKIIPNFNSNAIEFSLVNIPGLSEYFIYVNDDMYFGKELNYTDFFEQDKINKSLWRPIVYSHGKDWSFAKWDYKEGMKAKLVDDFAGNQYLVFVSRTYLIIRNYFHHLYNMSISSDTERNWNKNEINQNYNQEESHNTSYCDDELCDSPDNRYNENIDESNNHSKDNRNNKEIEISKDNHEMNNKGKERNNDFENNHNDSFNENLNESLNENLNESFNYSFLESLNESFVNYILNNSDKMGKKFKNLRILLEKRAKYYETICTNHSRIEENEQESKSNFSAFFNVSAGYSHIPFALSKTLFNEVCNTFSDEVQTTISNRFRSHNDIHMQTSMAVYGVQTNLMVHRDYNVTQFEFKFMVIHEWKSFGMLAYAISHRPKAFCINVDFIPCTSQVIGWLDNFYPNRSSFEKPFNCYRPNVYQSDKDFWKYLGKPIFQYVPVDEKRRIVLCKRITKYGFGHKMPPRLKRTPRPKKTRRISKKRTRYIPKIK